MSEMIARTPTHTFSKITQVICGFVVIIGILSLIGNLTDTRWSLPFENVIVIYELAVGTLGNLFLFWLPFSVDLWLRDFFVIWVVSFLAINLVFVEYTGQSVVALLYDWHKSHLNEHYTDYKAGKIGVPILGFWIVYNTIEFLIILLSSYFIYFLLPVKTTSFNKALEKTGISGSQWWKTIVYSVGVILFAFLLLGLNAWLLYVKTW